MVSIAHAQVFSCVEMMSNHAKGFFICLLKLDMWSIDMQSFKFGHTIFCPFNRYTALMCPRHVGKHCRCLHDGHKTHFEVFMRQQSSTSPDFLPSLWKYLCITRWKTSRNQSHLMTIFRSWFLFSYLLFSVLFFFLFFFFFLNTARGESLVYKYKISHWICVA